MIDRPSRGVKPTVCVATKEKQQLQRAWQVSSFVCFPWATLRGVGRQPPAHAYFINAVKQLKKITLKNKIQCQRSLSPPVFIGSTPEVLSSFTFVLKNGMPELLLASLPCLSSSWRAAVSPTCPPSPMWNSGGHMLCWRCMGTPGLALTSTLPALRDGVSRTALVVTTADRQSSSPCPWRQCFSCLILRWG